MINIIIEHENDEVIYLSSYGHAGYAEKGSDLVCAAVSAILFGGANAIDEEINSGISISDNIIEFNIQIDNLKVQNYLHCILIQLKTIEEKYPEYLRIDERS